ncbi:MAG: serine protein kinase PrkA [Desulfobacterales bacterium]
MDNIRNALESLDDTMDEWGIPAPMPFELFLQDLLRSPEQVLRNIFQVFHDMVKTYVDEGDDEYPDDPESIHFVPYDCTRLFVEGSDHPFFADRLFSNRLVSHVESMKRGAQQNKIYIFDGPPGCGKSTFLNNLLRRFEDYSNTPAGRRFEAVWRLDRNLLGPDAKQKSLPLFERMFQMMEASAQPREYSENSADPVPAVADRPSRPEDLFPPGTDRYVEVPCPSHDHPVLMIPKRFRRPFMDELFQNNEFKWKLFTEKEFEWVFRDEPCTICGSIYQALLNRLKSPTRVLGMLYARPVRFGRRLGEGISVFNPGDRPLRQQILTDPALQRRINGLLKDSSQVHYLFSRYAKTNNGIYALMDIKSHNIERLIELHNIISEGVHKVEDVEENVNSLLIALMNPEDRKNIQDIQSFSDRIESIKIPYVLDLNTEIDIYRDIFGKHIDQRFLPRVLHNFARVIISTRLNTRSDALLEWIGTPDKYRLYCDANLQLLKMEIYTGHIPPWLKEEDRKNFTAKRRRKIIGESESEGMKGLSGRDSIKIFNEFYSAFAREDKLINMVDLHTYFTRMRQDLNEQIPSGFLDSLMQMYNYTILQEVKESLYYYNEEQISRDILNYMFAVNFEPGTTASCRFTGDRLEITNAYLESFEIRVLGADVGEVTRRAFRESTQREYASRTLTQEILAEGLPPTQTRLFETIHERYVHHLKEKVLDPFLANENFRQAIKDYGEPAFKTHDRKIREDVTFLMKNLVERCRYNEQGAKEVCIYVIDNELARKFTDN